MEKIANNSQNTGPREKVYLAKNIGHKIYLKMTLLSGKFSFDFPLHRENGYTYIIKNEEND